MDVSAPAWDGAHLLVRLVIPEFQGEPDGGIAFRHQAVPFCLIVTGFSDSGTLTRTRAQHWITRGQPNVSCFYHIYSNLYRLKFPYLLRSNQLQDS